MSAWLVPLAATCGTYVLLRLLTRSGAAQWALDHPNERSLHARPVPRLGGIGIFPILALALFVLGFPLAALLSAALSALSFLDDRHQLSIGLRFLAHGLCAAVFVLFTLPGLQLWQVFGAVLAIMWMANLYNFMDGSDGLAGGMAAWGFMAYAVAAWLAGDRSLALATLSVSGCVLAFLFFNFPPAKLFLGDAGSIPLGFLAAALGFYGWYHQTWPWLFPTLVFSPFIVDASLTLLRRCLRRERILHAHNSHYYQRLIRMGWSHRKTALAAYALMFLCALSGLLVLSADAHRQTVVLLLAALFYMVLAALIDSAWRRFIDEST